MKKVQKIEQIIKEVKNKDITYEEFRLYLSDLLSSIAKFRIPVVIIDEKYPQIFINCDIQKFKFVFKGLYISTSLFDEFTERELTAAVLHEFGHIIRIRKDSSLIRKFFLSRTIAYSYLIGVSTVIKFIKPRVGKTNAKVLMYLMISLYIVALLILAISSYYYYKVGKEELIADSLATKLGYGRDLVSFIKRYQELEDLYGWPKLTDVARTFGEIFRMILRLVKVHPSNRQRYCEVMYRIITETEKLPKKSVYNYDLYLWTKEQYNKICKKHVPSKDVSDEVDKIMTTLVFNLRKGGIL